MKQKMHQQENYREENYKMKLKNEKFKKYMQKVKNQNFQKKELKLLKQIKKETDKQLRINQEHYNNQYIKKKLIQIKEQLFFQRNQKRSQKKIYQENVKMKKDMKLKKKKFQQNKDFKENMQFIYIYIFYNINYQQKVLQQQMMEKKLQADEAYQQYLIEKEQVNQIVRSIINEDKQAFLNDKAKKKDLIKI
ncbi:trichohyalin, putative [Ichthyophthirius multifiliis]|uniref:Trichohyalin, putative n=1 Tax=Ichthyophthirius multifiliis TaxID=5932 RepID=G0R5K4_ICHMU|nr:trichohyalin, putative [Ichthyophthirius multifiliis]EGR27264.1 trichohyalin, putative [Ichthyophthirius multifiliis]|eukprot:XP_004024148.1 trichohyalin, putative [Ichthyophthirius multifiliis]